MEVDRKQKYDKRFDLEEVNFQFMNFQTILNKLPRSKLMGYSQARQ